MLPLTKWWCWGISNMSLQLKCYPTNVPWMHIQDVSFLSQYNSKKKSNGSKSCFSYRIGFQPSNSSSVSVSSVHHNSTLSLVLFNLEPLTDSLEVLTLRGNLLQSLPMQFRGRNFSRLRKLDLSYNSLNCKHQLNINF